MNTPVFEKAVEEIVKKDPRFHPDAYDFLREALDFTLTRIMEGKPEGGGGMRHVSGMELLEGFRDFALEQYGPMSATVMREWGLKNGYHVGEMVYALIAVDVFAQQEGDSIDDFKGFMAFKDAFEKPYQPDQAR